MLRMLSPHWKYSMYIWPTQKKYPKPDYQYIEKYNLDTDNMQNVLIDK